MSDRQDDGPGWHLDRRVQISHIVATVTAVASCMYYVSRLEQRIALVEQQATEQRLRDDRQDAAASRAWDEIQRHLARIEDKLDRAIERSRGTR